MKSTMFSMFVPDAALSPLLVMAGILMIFGLRKAAGGVIVFVLICAFSPMFEPLMDALLDALPDWAVLLLAVFIVLQILRFVLEVFLGREAAGHVLASIIQSRITWTISALLALHWWVTGYLM